MTDQICSSTGGSPYDDNGFEKVLHADISPSTSPQAQYYGAGVEELYGVPTSSDTLKPLVPQPFPASTIHSSVASGACATKQEVATLLGCFSFVKTTDPRVIDLFYWRDVKKTGVVFGSLLVLLLSLALFSVLSVIAYLSLVILTITMSFRVYKNIIAAVQKTGEGHPFKLYLDMNVSLSEERSHRMADDVNKSLTKFLAEVRRLFLVEDVVDSIKFFLALWILTYIGAWFNGMTLIILAVVSVFCLPKVYETYKGLEAATNNLPYYTFLFGFVQISTVQAVVPPLVANVLLGGTTTKHCSVEIDQCLDLVKNHYNDLLKQLQEKISSVVGKKKKQS